MALTMRFVSTSRMRTGSMSATAAVARTRSPRPTLNRGRLPVPCSRRRHGPARRDRPARARAAARRHRRAPASAGPRRAATARAFPRAAARAADVAGIDAVEQALEAALQNRQRRPELVGDVGHQVAPLAVGVLQPLGHRVERAGKRANRRRAAVLDAHRVVAVRHAIRRIHHGAERRREAPLPCAAAYSITTTTAEHEKPSRRRPTGAERGDTSAAGKRPSRHDETDNGERRARWRATTAARRNRNARASRGVREVAAASRAASCRRTCNRRRRR